jgi:hypothetical protein
MLVFGPHPLRDGAPPRAATQSAIRLEAHSTHRDGAGYDRYVIEEKPQDISPPNS